MAERFRKSIRIAPGVKLARGNGMAWRFGQKNASVGLGRRCPVLAAGGKVPGAKEPVEITAKPGAQGARQVISIPLGADIDETGKIRLQDTSGNPLAADLAERTRLLRTDEVRILMQKRCDAVNRYIESLCEIHIYTPPPDTQPQYEAVRFAAVKPRKPIYRKRGFLGWLFKSIGMQVARQNAILKTRYEETLAAWEDDKAAHEARQASLREMSERSRAGDSAAMERLLDMKLNEIVWPIETLVTMSIGDEGKEVMMDATVPSIEQFPANFAIMPNTGLQLGTVEIPQAQVRYMYMRMLHALGFRLIGEVFSNLPTVNYVVLSVYVPTKNPDTLEVEEHFPYSVAVRRSEWRKVGFNQIRGIDVVAAFSTFTLRRGTQKAGVFSSITPFDKFPEQAATVPSPILPRAEREEEEDY